MSNLIPHCTLSSASPVEPTDALLDKISLEFPKESIVLRDPRRLFTNFVLADLAHLRGPCGGLQDRHLNYLRQRVLEEYPPVCAVYEVWLLDRNDAEKLENLLLLHKASLLSPFVLPVDLEQPVEAREEGSPLDSPVRLRRAQAHKSQLAFSPKLEALNNLGLLRVYLPNDNYLLIEEVSPNDEVGNLRRRIFHKPFALLQIL